MMTPEGFIELLVIVVLAAIVAGLGQFLTGYSRGGCPIAFLAACAGALAGPVVAERMGWTEPFYVPIGPVQFPLITSAAGALVLVLLVNLATKKRNL